MKIPRDDPGVRLLRLYCEKRGVPGKFTCTPQGTILFEPGKTLHIDMSQRIARNLEKVVDKENANSCTIDDTHRDEENVFGLSANSQQKQLSSPQDEGLSGYIEDLKQGAVRIQECLRKDDEVRQKAEAQIQKNVEDTHRSSNELEKLTDLKQMWSKDGVYQIWKRQSSYGLVFLPVTFLMLMVRAIVSFLFFPIIFLLTLWVIFSIPKK